MIVPAQIERPGQILLPFAEKEWIDQERTMRILGVGSLRTLYLLRRPRRDQPYLEVLRYGRGLRHRVLYSSVVCYCDWLREYHGIPDRRPQLDSPIFRHRDQDLLPFPLADTITTAEALAMTAYESGSSLRRRMAVGAFHCYRLVPDCATSPWRISRTDFARWLADARSCTLR